MPQFKLSSTSLDRMTGIDMLLSSVMRTAISHTTIDFGISEGLRSQERQAHLVDTGKSQTLQSKHIDGKAVDVLAYKNGNITWDHADFDQIAEAVRHAARLHNVAIRWGAAWTVPDIKDWADSMHQARMSYVEQRTHEGRKPFVDSPHFELA